MRIQHALNLLLSTTTLLTTTFAQLPTPSVPSLSVPPCPSHATIQYSLSVPNKTAFPLTQVSLCYSPTAINLTFTAYNETNFFYNTSYVTNDPIYEYEVMESFIALGTADPSTYLEFEVAPNNVTFNAFIYNPSKLRTKGAPFDTFYIQEPVVDGLVSETKLDREAEVWESEVSVPLSLFNVDEGKACGTRWRMNFFRTVVAPETFPDQLLGAWSVPDLPSFHRTPWFGHVEFV